MSEIEKRKVLTIKHDGKLYVSGYGALQLGDRALSDIVGEAMLLERNEYQELNAEVEITIKLKDKQPRVWWD